MSPPLQPFQSVYFSMPERLSSKPSEKLWFGHKPHPKKSLEYLTCGSHQRLELLHFSIAFSDGLSTKFRAQSNPRRERGKKMETNMLSKWSCNCHSNPRGVVLQWCRTRSPLLHSRAFCTSKSLPSHGVQTFSGSSCGVHSFWGLGNKPWLNLTFDRWWRQAGAKQSLWAIDGNWTCSVRHKLQRTTGDQKHWFTFQQVHMDIAEGRNFKMLCYEMSPRQEGHGWSVLNSHCWMCRKYWALKTTFWRQLLYTVGSSTTVPIGSPCPLGASGQRERAPLSRRSRPSVRATPPAPRRESIENDSSAE